MSCNHDFLLESPVSPIRRSDDLSICPGSASSHSSAVRIPFSSISKPPLFLDEDETASVSSFAGSDDEDDFFESFLPPMCDDEDSNDEFVEEDYSDSDSDGGSSCGSCDSVGGDEHDHDNGRTLSAQTLSSYEEVSVEDGYDEESYEEEVQNELESIGTRSRDEYEERMMWFDEADGLCRTVDGLHLDTLVEEEDEHNDEEIPQVVSQHKQLKATNSCNTSTTLDSEEPAAVSDTEPECFPTPGSVRDKIKMFSKQPFRCEWLAPITV